MRDATTKHTPSPWRIVHVTNGAFEIIGEINGYKNAVICSRNQLSCSPDESEANAHLIAAAPELLNALEELLELSGGCYGRTCTGWKKNCDDCTFTISKRVIAKAKGEVQS